MNRNDRRRPNKRNNKGFKPNKDINKGTEAEFESQPCKDGSPNDLSWYVVDEQILNDAARIPYSIPVGMPFVRDGNVNTHSMVALHSYDHAVSGILVSHVMPLLGPATSAGDPVNVAANNVYQYVRSRISGSRPYNAVDIMVYLGAMDSLYCVLTWLTRLYGTVFTYHQSNRYLSRALVEAQGIDYDDLVANLSSFRQQVNVLIAKVRGLYLPAVLPIFKRHSWIFSHYYIEGDSEKDQIYLHVPAGIHHFQYDNDGAGMLLARRFDRTTPITTQGLINTLNYLINPIYADEDFNRISGDLLKAYEGNVFTLTEIPDIATVQLMYNEEVLLQFKNAKYLSVVATGDSWLGNFFTYTQDTSKTYLEMTAPKASLHSVRAIDTGVNSALAVDSTSPTGIQARLSAKIYEWSRSTLLTSPHHDVVPGESMINSRLTLAATAVNDATTPWLNEFDQLAFGTEWPEHFEVYTYHRNKATNQTTLFRKLFEHVMYIAASTANDVNSLCGTEWPILSEYKYMPEILLDVGDANANTITIAARPVFEIDNYALVDYNVINGMHSAAILGEYNIPKLAIGK